MSHEKKTHQEENLQAIEGALTKSEQFIEKYQKLLIYGFSAIVVIIGLFFGYKKLIAEPREEKALAQMASAQNYFEQGNYKAALEAVTQTGDTPIKAGIIWLQGESDADFLTSPEMFRAATYDVLTSMRQDLGEPKMKVLVLEFYQSYAGRAGKLIRDQLPLAAKDLGAGFVNSDGATVRPDGVHLTTASHEKMGIRAAEVFKALK